MASRKKLVSAIQNVLTSIDLDAPVEPEVSPKPVAVEKRQEDVTHKVPQHVRDIVGDLSLDLD